METEGTLQAWREQSLVGVFIAEGGLLREVNVCFARTFGFESPDDLANVVNLADLLTPEDRSRALESLHSGVRCRVSGLRRNGQRFQAEIEGRAVSHQGKAAIMGMLLDVTELCRGEARPVRYTYYDALTNLPNRTLFFDRLKQAIMVAQREDNLLALLHLDLDNFRRINDQYGEAVGNEVLTTVAGRFAGALRASDTLARLGGDEFAVIATGLTFGDDVVPVALKLIAALEMPMLVSGQALTMGVSMGIALYPHHAGDADALYRAADAAMYGAKDKQRGGFCFYVGNVDAVESGGAPPLE